MKQRETKVCINGMPQTVRYRRVHTSQGVMYEGLIGNASFSFSGEPEPFHHSSLLDDIRIRNPLIAAVLHHEATQASDDRRDTQ